MCIRDRVRGGGAKPWKQKGTGRARAGSSSSPIWVGGGVAHGPKKKSYEFGLNKKEKHAALCSALSARRAEEKLVIVSDLGLKEIKTSAASAALVKAGLPADQKALVVLDTSNDVLNKSLRNIKNLKIAAPEGVSVYDILAAPWLVIVGDSFDKLVQRLTDGYGSHAKVKEATKA